MTDRTHPDPIDDPDGYAAYQAKHEDGEGTRVKNAKAAAKAENADAKKATAELDKRQAEEAEAQMEAQRQLAVELDRLAEVQKQADSEKRSG